MPQTEAFQYNRGRADVLVLDEEQSLFMPEPLSKVANYVRDEQ